MEDVSENPVPDVPKGVITGTLFEIFWNNEKQVVDWKAPSQPGKYDGRTWNKELLEYLFGLQEELKEFVPNVPIWTEFKKEGCIFHGHPLYREKKHWNDWVMINWGTNCGILPCEIWCFVDLSDLTSQFVLPYKESWVQQGVFTVVESSYYSEEEDTQIHSDLITRIRKNCLETTNDGGVLNR